MDRAYLFDQNEELRALKKRLRIQAEQVRSENLPYMQEYSELLCDSLFQLEEVKNADAFLSFVSFRSEISTDPIHRECLKRDIPLYLPVCEGKEMLFYRGDKGRLSPGAYGIPEPEKKEPLDFSFFFRPLILVPGLIFDRKGYRLGYGGGYYDRFLTEWSAKLTSVGIAFYNQIVDEIPISSNDRRVQAIVTERGLIPLQKQKS